MRIKNIFVKIIISIIIHFGKNPKKGGNPPIDKRLVNKAIFENKLKGDILKVWLIFIRLKLLKIKIILSLKNI